MGPIPARTEPSKLAPPTGAGAPWEAAAVELRLRASLQQVLDEAFYTSLAEED